MIVNSKQKENHLKLLLKHHYFDIELTANCNLACTFCPRDNINRNSSHMNDKIIGLLPEWLPKEASIMFSGMGEPLLHDKLLDTVDAITNDKRVIGITTNGHLLNKEIINRILKSKLDFLQISVNKIEDEEYMEISGGKSNRVLMENISYLSSKNNRIDIQFSFVKAENKLCHSDLNQQKIFSNKHGAKFFLKELHNRGGYLKYNTKKSYTGCNIFSQITYINSDGDILYCCHDIESNIIIGNVQKMTFNEVILNKEKIINTNRWLPHCTICNDKGRESLIT